MNVNEEIRFIKTAFDSIAKAKGKEKLPLIAATEGQISGRALLMLLDRSVIWHIGRKSLQKDHYLLPQRSFPSIFSLCDALSIVDSLNDQLLADVKGFINALDTDLQPFVCEFLQKTLRLGITMKTVERAYRNPPTPPVRCMLAKKYFEHPQAVDGHQFAITEKLDGFRCIAMCSPGERPVLLSRQGKRITGFDDIERAFSDTANVFGISFMADGELLIRNRIGIPSKEQYKRTSKIVSRRAEHKAGVVYNVFDLVLNGDVDEPYAERRKRLDVLFGVLSSIRPVPIKYIGDDTSMIFKCLDDERAASHEGVMINLLDAPYVYGRTTNLLKVKVMQDADLRIIGVREGVGKYAGTCGSIVVDYKGTEVGVGSGFTDQLRWEIWNNEEAFIGRVATIRYFEETTDANGVPSIRFPVFECLCEEGKTVSYE